MLLSRTPPESTTASRNGTAQVCSNTSTAAMSWLEIGCELLDVLVGDEFSNLGGHERVERAQIGIDIGLFELDEGDVTCLVLANQYGVDHGNDARSIRF